MWLVCNVNIVYCHVDNVRTKLVIVRYVLMGIIGLLINCYIISIIIILIILLYMDIVVYQYVQIRPYQLIARPANNAHHHV